MVSVFVFLNQSALAFPIIDFQGNATIASQYDRYVATYELKYQSLRDRMSTGQISQLNTRQLAITENLIAKAYKNRANATTILAQNRYDRTIRTLTKQLDSRIAGIERKMSSSGGIRTPNTPTPITPLPTVSPTWDGATSADLLYYADQFEGGGASNGNIFHHAGFSAARCNIDLNTLVQVRSGDSGVIVKVNDRPNCAKHPDIIDLTRTAFTTLAPLSKGRLDGSFLSLGKVSNSLVKEYLPTDFFANL